jgi:hypothetical protein
MKQELMLESVLRLAAEMRYCVWIYDSLEVSQNIAVAPHLSAFLVTNLLFLLLRVSHSDGVAALVPLPKLGVWQIGDTSLVSLSPHEWW